MNTVHSLAASRLRQIFENDLTVSHIAEFGLQYADPAGLAEELMKRMAEDDFDVMPIREEISTRYVDRSELPGKGTVLEAARPIQITDVVSESTSIIQTLRLLTARDWFFVLRGDAIAGIVTQADLRKPPVQMFLFGLLLLFEAKLLRLISHYLPNDQWQQCMNQERLENARKLLELKRTTNEALGLIDCLMLCDKGSIAEKTPELLGALNLSKTQAVKFFHRVENLRNALAHGEDFLQGSSWTEIMSLIERMEEALNAFDGTIIVDFSRVPSETALALAQNEPVGSLADLLAEALGLSDDADRSILTDEIVGVVAGLIDTYLKK